MKGIVADIGGEQSRCSHSSGTGEDASIFPRPMLVAANCFIIGILLEPLIHDYSPIALWSGITLFLGSLGLYRWRGSTLLLMLGFACMGSVSQHVALRRFPENHIARFTDDASALAHIRVKLIDEPRVLEFPNAPRPMPSKQIATAQVVEVLTKTGWIAATGKATLSITYPIEGLGIGDVVELTGQLTRPAPPDNPGQFDWSTYYRNDRILASFYASKPGAATLLSKGKPGLLDHARRLARNWLAAGFDKSRTIDLALLRALTLGDSDPQLREIQDEFVRTGTSHHLAISGMHIAVVGGLAMGLIRMLRVRPRVSITLGLLVTLLYGAVVLPNAPVVRSLLLCMTFGIAMLTGRRGDGVTLLSTSVLLMLAYNPLDLTNPGFQLSCGTVLALMLMTSPVLGWLAGLKDPDQAVADSFVRPKGFRKWRLAMGKTLKLSLATAMIAFLASAPIIAFHFNQLNPYAIFASVILAVPVFIALTAGVAKILLSAANLGTGFLATIAGWPVALMRWMVHLLDQLPGSNRMLPTPAWWMLLLYYALLLLPLWKRKRGWMRWSPVLCPVLLIAPALFTARPEGMRIRVLAVGSGQCAVVQLPSGKALMFDAGTSSPSDLSRSIVAPTLKQWRIDRIDAVFLSHGNIDHFGLLDELVGRVEIGKVYAPTNFAEHGGEQARKLLELLEKKGIAIVTLSRGTPIELDDASISVLSPAKEENFKANDSSLVLKLSVYNKSILFTGDIQNDGMDELLKNPQELKTDVLMAPHHGSFERATPAFVAATSPEIFIASSDRVLSGKQNRLNALRTPMRTGSLGAVDVTIKPDGEIKALGFHR